MYDISDCSCWGDGRARWQLANWCTRGANAVVRPLNRPRLDEQQIVVGRIDIGPLKRLNRLRPNGLQTVVVHGGVEVVCITLGNYHVEPSILKHARVLRLVGLVPRSTVSLLLGFSSMLSVSLVLWVTARSLHDNMLGCQSPSGEWSWNISRLQHGLQLIMARYTRIINCRPCCNVYLVAYKIAYRRGIYITCTSSGHASKVVRWLFKHYWRKSQLKHL